MHAPARPQAPTDRVRPPTRPIDLPTHRTPAAWEPGKEGRVSDQDRRWLRPRPGGPDLPPREPPRRPTGFDGSGSAGFGPGRHEPPPFHQRWIVAGVLAFAACWVALWLLGALLVGR